MNGILVCGRNLNWLPNNNDNLCFDNSSKCDFGLEDVFTNDKIFPHGLDSMKHNKIVESNNIEQEHLMPKIDKDINRNMRFNFSTAVNGGYLKTEVTENGFSSQEHFPANCSSPNQQSPQQPKMMTNSCQNPSIAAAVPARRDQRMDVYRDLILHHLIQDISNTCEKLGLPTDPYAWSTEHVAKWIREMCQQFSLTLPKNCYFTGRILLQMSQRDFEAWAPEGGDTIYAQLQLWKTAFESYHHAHQTPINPPSQQNEVENIVERNNWQTQPTTNVKDTMMNGNFDNSPIYSNPQSIPYNKTNSPTQLQESPVFFNSNMLSPSSSDMSSSASITDMGDDDNIDLGLFNIQRPDMPFGNCANGVPMNEDDKPSSYSRHTGTVHLWHFIRELLDHPKQYGSCVRWVDREEGTFKIESSHHLARFWGQRKNRSQMNYDKLSRSLRQYYKKGIIQKPEKKQRLVYKFLPPYNL